MTKTAKCCNSTLEDNSNSTTGDSIAATALMLDWARSCGPHGTDVTVEDSVKHSILWFNHLTGLGACTCFTVLMDIATTVPGFHTRHRRASLGLTDVDVDGVVETTTLR